MNFKACPAGYEYRNGDVAGWGSNLGSKLSLTRQECADRCTEIDDCLSFEQSATKNLCNLNRIGEPNREPKDDYALCAKQRGMHFCLH